MKTKIGYFCLTLLSSAIILVDFHSRILSAKELTPLESAQLIPQEALISVFISASQDLHKINQAMPSEVQDLIKSELNTFVSQTAALEAIDYQQDIRPWLGNVVFVLLENNVEPERYRGKYLLILGIKNKLNLLKFADTLEKLDNVLIESNNYQNTPIVKVTDNNSNTLRLAILKNQILLSPDLDVLETAISTQQLRGHQK